MARSISTRQIPVLACVLLLACSDDESPTTQAPLPPPSDYTTAVQRLAPTHYYRLNETEFGAVANIGSNPVPALHEGVVARAHAGAPDSGIVGVPGPDFAADGTPLFGFAAPNRALYCNGTLAINLGNGADFASPTMTVALWFKVPCDPDNPGVECQGPPASSGGERIFSNNFPAQDTGGSSDVDDLGHFQIVLGWGTNIAVSIDNNFFDPLKSSYQIVHGDLPVKDHRWHHIVASRNGDDLFDGLLVVDGVEITQDRWMDSNDSWGIVAPYRAKIGAREPSPATNTFNGWIDEVAIWLDRQLTVAEAKSLYDAATQ